MSVDVSVVIPNYNSPVIGEAITSLLSQSFTGNYEIVIAGVDDLGLVKQSGMVRFVDTKKRVFPGEARNVGVKAALGIHQLPRIEKYLKRRQEIWQRYDKAFKGLPVITPAEPQTETKHSRHLYTILLDTDRLKVDRDVVQQALYRENVGTGIHYIALHLHSYYAKAYGYKNGDFPNAEYISERTISLPMSVKLTDEDVEDVIATVSKMVLGHLK